MYSFIIASNPSAKPRYQSSSFTRYHNKVGLNSIGGKCERISSLIFSFGVSTTALLGNGMSVLSVHGAHVFISCATVRISNPLFNVIGNRSPELELKRAK